MSFLFFFFFLQKSLITMQEEKKADIVETTNAPVTYEDENFPPSYAQDENLQGPEPTEQDWKELPEVSDKIPKAAFLVILVEFCERFTYYGLSGPFQNYIQHKNPDYCKLL